MIQDYYLKASNENEMRSILSNALGTPEADIDLHNLNYTINWDINVVTTPGVFDTQGNLITTPTFESGFFANLRLLNTAPYPHIEQDLSSVLLGTPATPYANWY